MMGGARQKQVCHAYSLPARVVTSGVCKINWGSSSPRQRLTVLGAIIPAIEIETRRLIFACLCCWSTQDLPVEHALMFREKVDRFMREHLAPSDGRAGVLGRVLHWFIRYEIQGRCG